MKKNHDPREVAQIAAHLLSGYHDAEPHHIKMAIAAARTVLDQANTARPLSPEEVADAEALAEARKKSPDAYAVNIDAASKAEAHKQVAGNDLPAGARAELAKRINALPEGGVRIRVSGTKADGSDMNTEPFSP